MAAKDDKPGRRELDRELLEAYGQLPAIQRAIARLEHAVFGLGIGADRGLIGHIEELNRTAEENSDTLDKIRSGQTTLLVCLLGASISVIGGLVLVLVSH